MDLIATVVAAAALIVAILSYRYARQAPARARQASLRDEVRAYTEQLRDWIAMISEQVRVGSTLTNSYEELTRLRDALAGYSGRLALLGSEVENLSHAVMSLRTAWYDVNGLHKNIDATRTHVTAMRKLADSDEGLRPHVDAEDARLSAQERALPAAVGELQKELADTSGQVKDLLRKLDNLDRAAN